MSGYGICGCGQALERPEFDTVCFSCRDRIVEESCVERIDEKWTSPYPYPTNLDEACEWLRSLNQMPDPHGTKQQQTVWLFKRGWEFDDDAMCWCRWNTFNGEAECFNSTREAIDYQLRLDGPGASEAF